MNRTLATLAIFSLLSVPAWAQRNLTDIPDPDPEIERRSFQVADGLEVSLYAADPLIAKPIQMNFDARGRLWIASSEVYPQIAPGQVANDKILVLEDKDGDGKAESTTVFADGLLIPTGVEPGNGGAYVANSTELLFLKDTDGDGKADSKRVVLSGFGTEDTHHILHTLRWGYDGMLYMNQSIYIHSHIETPHGVRRLNGGGVWQFRPETMQLEVFIRGLVNSWGHHYDRFGQSFVTDGAGGEGINYALPGAYYFTAPDAVRILQGLNPGSPKHCGLEVISGRHLPESWQGSLLTNDFRGNRVCRFVVSDDGAGFASREQPELIKTSHVAFRPIDVKMGPDGAIYIADWYNPIIQHGEVDFRDPRRDHTRGRIWRVTVKNRPLVPRPRLEGAPVPELLEALKAPEGWTRHFARLVLKERGADAVVPALTEWFLNLDAGDPQVEQHRLEALWTFQALDVVEPTVLKIVLASADGRVRAAAVRVVSQWHPRLSDPLELLAPRAADGEPRVRLEAVRALAQIPQTRSAELALWALERPMDKFLDYALWLTLRQLQPVWLPQLLAGRFEFDDPRKLVFALEATGSPAAVRPLMEALRAGRIPRDREDSVLTLMASLGEPSDLGMILDTAIADAEQVPARTVALLDALGGAARRRKVAPSGDLLRLGGLIEHPEVSVRASAVRAAGLWKVGGLHERVLRLAKTSDSNPDIRRAAIDALALYGAPEDRAALDKLAGSDGSLAARAWSVIALAGLDLPAAAGRATEVLAADQRAEVADAVVAAFNTRQEGPQTLAAALKGKSIPRDVAKRGVRLSSSGTNPLLEAFTTAGGLTAATLPPTPEEVAQLVADVNRLGDPARGEAVFRRAENQCLKCHAIAGAGGLVGPGLESIGASAPVDYLVDSLMLPDKAVKENYNSTVVATSDGQIFTGIKVRQTDTDLVLRDAEDREQSIPLDAIEEQKPGKSLMPAGLTDSLTRQELLDLVRFLSALGKIGDYSVSKERLIRRWEVLEANGPAITAVVRDRIDAAALKADDRAFRWTPVFSMVSGELPLDVAPPFPTAGSPTKVGFLRARLDVTTPGKIKLVVNTEAGLKLWVDGVPVTLARETVLDLPTGLRTLTFAAELTARAEPLRVAVEDLPGSPAKAQPVLGR